MGCAFQIKHYNESFIQKHWTDCNVMIVVGFKNHSNQLHLSNDHYKFFSSPIGDGVKFYTWLLILCSKNLETCTNCIMLKKKDTRKVQATILVWWLKKSFYNIPQNTHTINIFQHCQGCHTFVCFCWLGMYLHFPFYENVILFAKHDKRY